jgi:hypothetical protein
MAKRNPMRILTEMAMGTSPSQFTSGPATVVFRRVPAGSQSGLEAEFTQGPEAGEWMVQRSVFQGLIHMEPRCAGAEREWNR